MLVHRIAELRYNSEMISVCIATYNGSSFIAEQLKSILDQLGPMDEVIVSDDGSSDITLEIIHSFKDRRIQIFHFGQKNLIKNFENALRKASGDYIFLSDQDDIWHPDKVKICLGALKKDASVVVSDCCLIDELGAKTDESYFSIHPPTMGLLSNFYKNSFMGCCMAFNKNILQKALPFPSSIPMHDSWIGMVALTNGENVVFLEDKLVQYRRHSTVTSSTGSKSNASFALKITSRWNLAGRLLFRRLGLA